MSDETPEPTPINIGGIKVRMSGVGIVIPPTPKEDEEEKEEGEE